MGQREITCCVLLFISYNAQFLQVVYFSSMKILTLRNNVFSIYSTGTQQSDTDAVLQCFDLTNSAPFLRKPFLFSK